MKSNSSSAWGCPNSRSHASLGKNLSWARRSTGPLKRLFKKISGGIVTWKWRIGSATSIGQSRVIYQPAVLLMYSCCTSSDIFASPVSYSLVPFIEFIAAGISPSKGVIGLKLHSSRKRRRNSKRPARSFFMIATLASLFSCSARRRDHFKSLFRKVFLTAGLRSEMKKSSGNQSVACPTARAWASMGPISDTIFPIAVETDTALTWCPSLEIRMKHHLSPRQTNACVSSCARQMHHFWLK